MKPINEVLTLEEAKWRAKSYEEIAGIVGTSQCYQLHHGDVTYEVEVHSKAGASTDEIVVMVECSIRKKLVGTYRGQAKYFAISQRVGARDIEPDEAF